VRAERSIATLFGHTGPVNDIAFGPGSVLATASGDGTAITWRADGLLARRLLGHDGPVRKVAFAADGHVVTGGADGTLRVWDPGTAVDLARAVGTPPPSPARTTATAPDGSTTATVEGEVIRLRHGAQETVLEGHDDEVNSVSFSPDGQRLVSAARDHDVIVWDVETGGQAFRIDEAQSATVQDARFSPDGRWLVTAGPRSARLWTADGEVGRYLYGPRSPVTAVAFEPDSRGVVSVEKDGVVRRWRCELCGGLDELTALAQERLRGTGRTLTEEQRARFLD
jgi:WD40 repeat protein